MRYFVDDQGDAGIYGHANCEDPGGRFWRHGRAWIHVRRIGRRAIGRWNPARTMRGDVEFGAEWVLLRERTQRPDTSHSIGLSVKVGTAGSEQDLALHVGLGRLASLFVHSGGLLPGWALARGYESRVTELMVGTDHLHWEFWHPRHSWKSGTPRHRYWHVDYERVLFGNSTVEWEVTDSGRVDVPMPEGVYPATYEVKKGTWTWPNKPLGRFRPAIVRFSTTIAPDTPIPVPGKGENSWDCGDDAIHEHSGPGQNVAHAVGATVGSALRDRRAYGGPNWTPPAVTEGAPA